MSQIIARLSLLGMVTLIFIIIPIGLLISLIKPSKKSKPNRHCAKEKEARQQTLERRELRPHKPECRCSPEIDPPASFLNLLRPKKKGEDPWDF